MDLVSDLGEDLAKAVLIEKKHSGKIDSKEIVSLISKIREVLEPVSAKDHSTLSYSPNIEDATSIGFPPIVNEATNSH